MGVDGSEGMLEVARSCGLYQELKQSTLGEEPMPVQSGETDSVVQLGYWYKDMFFIGEVFLDVYSHFIFAGYFDVVVIAGALSVGQVPVPVVRELCNSAKSGGLFFYLTCSCTWKS